VTLGVPARSDAVAESYDADGCASLQLLPGLGQLRDAELGLCFGTLPLLPMRIICIHEEPPVAEAGELVVLEVFFAIENVGAEIWNAGIRRAADLARRTEHVILALLVMDRLRQPVPVGAADR